MSLFPSNPMLPHLYKNSNITKCVAVSFFLFCFVFNAISQSVPMLRLKMNGLVNSLDETVVYYQDGATDGFDSEYDAYKIVGPNPAPHISQVYNSVLMVINGIEPVVQTFSINITATTPTTGNFTITATDFADLPKGTCVYLNDVLTGNVVNILTSPYAFNLSNTTSNPRFILSITHYELQTISSLTQPSCKINNGGKFKVTGNSNAPWNYTWKDSVGAIVKTLLNSNTCDSLDNLSNGIYSVEVTSANNSCYFKETTFTINQIVLPMVSFNSPDTITASIMQNFIPINQSTNCESYYWNFGDASEISTNFEPGHSYTFSGLFKAKLTGISSSGCKDSTQRFVNVIDVATHLMVELNQNIKLIDMGNSQFKIKRGNFSADEIFINLVDLTGKTILYQHGFSNESEDILLDLNMFKYGIYALSIGYKDELLKSSKIHIK